MKDIYRGYVPTRNKKSLIKFSGNAKLLTLDEVKNSEEYAGILAEDVILIDIDDGKESEKLMDIIEDQQIDCRVYQTTRGKHFLFRNTGVNKCSTHTRLAIGLTADIKIGSKNSYEVIKFKGKERFIEWDSDELSKLPAFLLPVKSDIDFAGLGEGKGRNQAFFNYILTLQKVMEKADIKKTISLINRFILPKPLPESELNVILRDEAFPKKKVEEDFFTSSGAFKFDAFSRFLIEKYRIIKINKQLHIYDNGVYKEGLEAIQSKMIEHIPYLNRQKRSEVLAYIDILVRKDSKPIGARYIAFKNGIYDLDNGSFGSFDPDIIITNCIPHNFNDKAYSTIADQTLDRLACHDKDIRTLLEETIGYTFYRRNELRKAFILTGDKANGKSTFLNMITYLLGGENVSALDLGELGDRFKTAELFGKLANIGDDIGDEFIPNPAIFKKVVSGDRVNAERKGKDPFDFTSYAKLLFSANAIPRIKDKSGAVIDRLIIVPFNATFSKGSAEYDPYIKYKLQTEEVMEYLVQLGIKGLKRVLDNQGFTVTDQVISSLKEYEEQNNPILLFFAENDRLDIAGQKTKVVYQRYAEFCISNNYQQLSNIEFSKQIKKFYKLDIKVTKADGKSERVFL